MRFTIKTKLGLAFGGILVFTAAAGGLGISSLSSNNATMEDFARRPFNQVQRVGELQTDMFNSARLLTRAVADSSDASKESSRKQFEATKNDFENVLQQYSALVPADEREARVSPVRTAWSNYIEQTTKAWALTLQNNNIKSRDLAFAKSKPAVDAILAAYQPLVAFAKSTSPRSSAEDNLIDFRLNLESMRLQRYKVIAASDDDAIRQMAQAYDVTLSRAQADLSSVIQDLEQSMPTQVAALRSAFDAYIGFDKEVLRLATLNTDGVAIGMLTSGGVKTTRDTLGDNLAKLKTYESEVAATFLSEAHASYASTRDILIGVVASAVLLGLAMAFWIALSISRGLSQSVALVEAVAAGDLTKNIDARGRDEIGDLQRAMKRMADKLHEVVGQVSVAARNVSSGSQELSASAEQLSQGSTE
ncbi:methyl-accepting chemotaxis protein, partial [Lichenibacterium minor]